jgi:hypothetical protein
VITVRPLLLCTGYRYLMHPVQAASGPVAYDVSSLERYYSASGTLAGRFLGGGPGALT